MNLALWCLLLGSLLLSMGLTGEGNRRWPVTSAMVYLAVGLAIGSALVLVGVAAHLRPSFTTELGAVAIVLSLASVFGALGGLVVGLLLGVVGGSLCVAWKPTAG